MAHTHNYRKIALEHYDPICAYCGFGIPEVLEVAHVDGNRANNAPDNLVILCPNCHKMHDVGLIPTETIVCMRDREKRIDWSKRMKDAGQKAATTKRKHAAAKRKKGRAAARKAAQTRRRRMST